MKDNYRLIPIWFLPILLLAAVLLLGQCGCRTGGKWVSEGSTGANQIITPSELERQPNGTYRIKPKESEPPLRSPAPIKPIDVKNTPVQIESSITKPKPPEIESAKAEKLPPANIKAAGLIAPFKPTVTTPRLEEKVNVKPIKNPPAKIIEGEECIVITDPMTPMTPEKEASVKVNWMELFMFYFLVVMGIIFIWLLYDLWREYKKAKLPKTTKKKIAPKKTTKKATKKRTRKKTS